MMQRLLLLLLAVAVVPSATATAAEPPSGDLRSPHASAEYAIFFLESPKRAPTEAVTTLIAQGYASLKVVTEPVQSEDVEVVAAVADNGSYAPPSRDLLAYFGRGLSKAQETSVQDSKRALVIRFFYPKSCIPGCVFDTQTFMAELQARLGGLLYDKETRELFSDAAWREARLDSWEFGKPDIRRHIAIHAYENDRSGDGRPEVRSITLGMNKFALPDISISGFPWSLVKPAGLLTVLLAQQMYERPETVLRGVADVKLAELKHGKAKEYIETRLDNSATGTASITLGWGQKQEGDNDNRILEVLFDAPSEKSLTERQTKLFAESFGFREGVVHLAQSEELEDASERAKKKLPKLRREFKYGLPAGDFIMVKAPFDRTGGGREYMWIEVKRWTDDGIITGLLRNEPENIPDLKAGQVVSTKESDVFDFLVQRSNGAVEGNETARLLEKERNGSR